MKKLAAPGAKSAPKSPQSASNHALKSSSSKSSLGHLVPRARASPSEEAGSSNRAEIRKTVKKKVPVLDTRKSANYVEAANAVISDKGKTDSDKTLILAALSRHFIFTSLSSEYQMVIVEAMKHYRLGPRETVFEQDQPAASFFILASGRLEVIVGGRQVNTIKPGEGFGELALLHDTPRSASIKTLEPCTLWAVDGKTFRHFLQTVNQQNYTENKAFINSVQLFAALTDEQKESLVISLTSQQYVSGQKIVNEGDPGDLFYIIKDGVVSCTKGGIEVRRLSKGEFFGEQALLYGGTRTATVTAVEGQVKCVSIGRADLVQVLGNHLQHIIYRNTQRIAFEKNDILKRLSKEQSDRLIDAMRVNTYTNGQVVIPRGQAKGVKLWVVLKGALGLNGFRVIAETLTCIGELEIGSATEATFGEGLIAVGEQVHVAEIDKGKFEECLGGGLAQATVNNEALKILKRVQLLRGLAPDRLPVLIQALQIREYTDGEKIVEQRTRGDTFFIIKSGKVDVLKDGVNIRTITKHDYFGERSVLFNEIRTATVVARGPVSCWTLQQSDFLAIIDEGMRKALLNRIELQDDSIVIPSLMIVKTLGKGMFGNVFLTVNPEKGTLYALKTVSRRKIEMFEIEENILLERRMLLQLDHTFIVKLIKTFKDQKRLYFLMEFVKGMDLFDVLRQMGLLNDQDARFFIAGLILMMEHLHERDIIYRDLKPENVMIDEEGYPKLIDFGTAKIIQNRTYTIVGTPHYMAPEVIMGKGYGLVADIYSIGIMLFEFVCGSVPFGEDEEDPYVVYEKVLEHRIVFPHFLDPRMPCRPIIEQLINNNPAMRTGGSMEHLKAHRWFKDLDWVMTIQDQLLGKQLRPPFVPPSVNLSKEVSAAINKRAFAALIDVRPPHRERNWKTWKVASRNTGPQQVGTRNSKLSYIVVASKATNGLKV